MSRGTRHRRGGRPRGHPHPVAAPGGLADLAVAQGPGDDRSGRLLPDAVTLDNYSSLFEGGFDSPLLKPLLNSISIALIATVIAIVPAAHRDAIARLDFPGKALILAGALAVAMFPLDLDRRDRCSTCGRDLGLYDTWPGLIIPYLTFALPLAIYTVARSSGRSPGSSSRPRRWTAPHRFRPSAR